MFIIFLIPSINVVFGQLGFVISLLSFSVGLRWLFTICRFDVIFVFAVCELKGVVKWLWVLAYGDVGYNSWRI
ncbi:unnamed protein product [Lactuca virosa]|uniref:Uncharacterized protein n=1 Tax=Lactuca virosa TaxID=75947 RepID=A0AAU9NVC5_9ASTR|nr:unnamed protein product [Lactuca virosa]